MPIEPCSPAIATAGDLPLTLWQRIRAKLPKTLAQQENELFERFDACLSAIEIDRARRGEPVAMLFREGFNVGVGPAYGTVEHQRAFDALPSGTLLYASPQHRPRTMRET